MQMRTYTLDEKNRPVPCDDFMEWGLWCQANRRHVAETTVAGLWVSTVFLGIDHSLDGSPPVLFETMVFDHDDPVRCARTCTWEEAEQMHAAIVAEIDAAGILARLDLTRPERAR